MAGTSKASTSATQTLEKAAPSIPLYSQSSQFRNWRYSNEELDDIRRDLNVKAVERVRKNVEEERLQQSADPIASTSMSTTTSVSSATTSRSSSPTPGPSVSEIEYLTVSDEMSLVAYYLERVVALCGGFRFPEMVEATAMTYLKRFYLRNTCMDYHPKNVMLTCLFLATKTENHPISIDTFSSKTKSTPTDILSLEFLVSQSLRFEYKVHHAHLAAYGLSLDLQSAKISAELGKATYTLAQQYIKSSRHSSLEFIYTPSQIALACFRLADASVVDSWLGVKEGVQSGKKREEDMQLDDLVRVLEEIGEIVKSCGNKVDVEVVREVDKRLRWARNPEKDPKSALFKKRQAEEEIEREDKAKAKAAKRPVSSDHNVFN